MDGRWVAEDVWSEYIILVRAGVVDPRIEIPKDQSCTMGLGVLVHLLQLMEKFLPLGRPL